MAGPKKPTAAQQQQQRQAERKAPSMRKLFTTLLILCSPILIGVILIYAPLPSIHKLSQTDLNPFKQLVSRATALETSGNYPAAIATWTSLLDDLPDPLPLALDDTQLLATASLALAQFNSGEHAKATLLTPIIVGHLNRGSHPYLPTTVTRVGQLASTLFPDHPAPATELQIHLTAALKRQNEFKEYAPRVWSPYATELTRLVRLLLRSGEIERMSRTALAAVTVLDANTGKFNPASIGLQVLVGAAAVVQGELADADAILEVCLRECVQRYGVEGDVCLLAADAMGVLRVKQGKKEEAGVVFAKVAEVLDAKAKIRGDLGVNETKAVVDEDRGVQIPNGGEAWDDLQTLFFGKT